MEIEIKTRQQGRQHDCIKAAIESGSTMICASQAQADKLMAKYPGLKAIYPKEDSSRGHMHRFVDYDYPDNPYRVLP